MTKPLNLTQEDKVSTFVTYNVNRYEIYHKDGWFMTAASNTHDLQNQIFVNGLINPIFDAISTKMYLASK